MDYVTVNSINTDMPTGIPTGIPTNIPTSVTNGNLRTTDVVQQAVYTYPQLLCVVFARNAKL